ncbi:MAG: MBL fold metallo-hydrolase [Desulfurobacteriaceae bacterium]
MKAVIIPSGPFLVNTTLVWDEESREAMLVDPGDKRSVEEAKDVADREELTVKYIVNTHEHPDHTAANSWAKLYFPNAKLLMHPQAAKDLNFWTESEIGQMAGAEYSPQPDRTIEEGDELKLGSKSFKVLHTPGHSPGSIVLYCSQEKIALVGDLIFKGSIGRYDLPKSDYSQLKRSIFKVLNELDPKTKLITGHGESTTLERELKENPFISGLF